MRSARRLDAEIAAGMVRVGDRFDHIGHTYVVTKVGRDRYRTLTLARPSRDMFGKEVLIDPWSFPASHLDRYHLRPLRAA